MQNRNGGRGLRSPSCPPPTLDPGTEPGIQAAPSVIISRTSALDTRIKPAYDEAESRQRLALEPQFVIPTPP
jgi:hypothetical protein